MAGKIESKFDTPVDYPVGIQSFETIREDGYLYVDKTALIYGLVRKGGFYFLSRPRRFGKSLMISTIEAYYRGRRDLFKGLDLDRLTDNWEPHPILHLDLSTKRYETPEDLTQRLSVQLDIWEEEYEVTYRHEPPANELRFSAVIRAAYQKTGRKVAILVDEYDSPLLGAIDNEELADDYRSQLKAFYSNLKSMGQYIRIAVLTGVARFSKISIFSDLNNLHDISFTEDYAAICGITAEELDRYFHYGIKSLAARLECGEGDVRTLLCSNYDGYHFAKVSPDIYNPFSLMNVFKNLDFADYWFQSGTPSYLLHLIEHKNWVIPQNVPTSMAKNELMGAGLFSNDPVPTLYQAGYLTIKAFNPSTDSFILDFPNREVKEGFLKFLIPYYLRRDGMKGEFAIPEFIREINSGEVEEFMRRLDILIAQMPYSEKSASEAHFQNAVYLLFTLMGYDVRMEERISNGRIDIILETSRYIYIFEFKIGKSAQEAMKQIHEKRYWTPYELSGKYMYLIGADFNPSSRRLSSYLIEKIP